MLLQWTCDLGDGPCPVDLPHTWHGLAPVGFEGPALYQAAFIVPHQTPWLVFHGVSCRCSIRINGMVALVRTGIWDAFSLDLREWVGQRVQVEVEVVKNGGPTVPVGSCASGFLPYVYHTFGGIFRAVELSPLPFQEPPQPASQRVTVDGGRVLVDGAPFFARGILTWGWNPRTASCLMNPQEEEALISAALRHGFNTIKFCLWAPSHQLLDRMEEEGLMAWLELPVWMPSPHHLEEIRDECLRIVRQYRGHGNILAWTAGCELGEGIDPEWRRSLVEDIQGLTGHPLVKDNSGGAEMYGGHPIEHGTFDDFHPYCDPAFFPLVLDSLVPGPREVRPTFLGETNDYDVFRPVHQWVQEPPYWASPDPILNEQGARWQYDLPGILEACRTTHLGVWLEEREACLTESSLSQSHWMRTRAFDAMRLVPRLCGWAITGERHTPISSAGILDDEGRDVLPPNKTSPWNAEHRLILLPRRSPPWVMGGNRPGWENPRVRWEGPALFQVALHSGNSGVKSLGWEFPELGLGGECPVSETEPYTPKVVGTFVADLPPGKVKLRLCWGSVTSEEVIHVVERRSESDQVVFKGDPETFGFGKPASGGFWVGRRHEGPGPGLVLCEEEGTSSRPWFRESCWSWEGGLWSENGWVNEWDLLSMVAGDRVLTPAWLNENWGGWEPLLVRLDTRTFERSPVAVKTSDGVIVTTLRPHGGLGIQPTGVSRSPAGTQLMRILRRAAEGAAELS
jgi:hypothetical protein